MNEGVKSGAGTGQDSGRDLPKRFYERAEAAENESGFAVHLDGRPVRTPGRNLVAVPTFALAAELALEWAAQSERIDPWTMPLNRLVNSALDGVAGEMAAVRAEIVKYSGSDLLCYRADGPERLVERQTRSWDPVLDWARRDLGARFMLAEGVMFVRQDEAATSAIAREVSGLDPVPLAAANVITTLTGSAILAVAVLRRHLDAETAWALANVDEDWNSELWGEDEEAAARRRHRWLDMQAAVRTLELSRTA